LGSHLDGTFRLHVLACLVVHDGAIGEAPYRIIGQIRRLACVNVYAAHDLAPFIARPDLFLQTATNLPLSTPFFFPRSRSDWVQKISSQLSDGSIKAEHGTP